MKTTVELPDDLIRRVKMRAIERNQKLKDALAQLLEQGMANEPSAVPAHPMPRAVRMRKLGPLKIGDIEAAIASGRD